MAFKCENVYCPYGPEWDQGLPVTRDGMNQVPRHLRADSYSQEPKYRIGAHIPWNGYCLDCINDQEKDERGWRFS